MSDNPLFTGSAFFGRLLDESEIPDLFTVKQLVDNIKETIEPVYFSKLYREYIIPIEFIHNNALRMFRVIEGNI